MATKNIIYAQSGGATAVINVTARAVIEEARYHPQTVDRIYAASGGITGILTEKIFDLTDSNYEDVWSIENEPGAFFGTCRYKLDTPEKNPSQYDRIVSIFKEYNIGYFFYNGGNDSQDTTNRIAEWCSKSGIDVQCIGIPKTVDNDLAGTDSCPGFGSVAKYIATATAEVTADLLSICGSSTKVFVLETMGRDAGWIAAAAGLVKKDEYDSPQIILLPEVAFDKADFLKRVRYCVENIGYCFIVASEGIKDQNNNYLTASTVVVDSFGHQQLGGVAPALANMIKQELGYKYHWAVPDYLQRASKHIVSETDYLQAEAVGKHAVELAMDGKREIMVGVKRVSEDPYRWEICTTPLAQVANSIKAMPANYFDAKTSCLTAEGFTYYSPLIRGEKYPKYANGLMQKTTLIKKEVDPRLPPYQL